MMIWVTSDWKPDMGSALLSSPPDIRYRLHVPSRSSTITQQTVLGDIAPRLSVPR